MAMQRTSWRTSTGNLGVLESDIRKLCRLHYKMPTTYTCTGLFIIRLLSYFIMQNLTVTSHSANQTSTCHKLEKFLSSFALYSIEARTSPFARNGTTPLPSRRLAIAKGGTHQLLPLFQILNTRIGNSELTRSYV